jgi:hypothetical protein
MKMIYFLRWCFDTSRWQPYQKRTTALMILSIILAVFFEDIRLTLIPLLGLWLELVCWAVKDQWNSYCAEQKSIIKTLKGKR